MLSNMNLLFDPSLQVMLGEYHWTTFDEVSHRVNCFGQGLLALGLDPRQYILLFAETRMEYMIAVQAAFKFNFPGEGCRLTLLLILCRFLSLVIIHRQWSMFLSLGIFVLFTTPQSTQLYKWVPCYRQWWTCEWIVVARNCCMTRMLPREAELVSEWTGLPR